MSFLGVPRTGGLLVLSPAQAFQVTSMKHEAPWEAKRNGAKRLQENMSISWQICRFLVTGLFDAFIRFQSGWLKWHFALEHGIVMIGIEIWRYVTQIGDCYVQTVRWPTRDVLQI